MANIYEEKNEPLHALIERARSADGATVLIPDLQRPYVWTPNQVTLLVDSLIRGWPFGTLLMWKADAGELERIPHRQFWQVVDRTETEDGTTVARRDPPASFHMVLDGQQRVQSLLLALGGDSWGFKLEDRDWMAELHDRRPRGPRGKRHWSKASLCFNLEAFERAYAEMGGLQGIEFRNMLQWVITDPVDGQPKERKPATYNEPLLRAFDAPHKGKYVRLSRLWQRVTPNAALRESHFQQEAANLFAEEGVPKEQIDRLRVAAGELLSTFRDVKLGKITYLELQAFDAQLWGEDAYNDAIVNIFTRLNTAGRTLTRQEITLAWLKVGWVPSKTGDQPAGVCFERLGEGLADRGMKLDIDELVAAVSLIWSVKFNNGSLLANKDLLRGAAIRPMANTLSQNWSVLTRAILDGLDRTDDRGLKYGGTGQYDSLYAAAILWAWLYLAFDWAAAREMKVLERDAFEKSVWEIFDAIADRWLICSSWADRWAGKPAESAQRYAKELNEAAAEIAKAPTVDAVLNLLRQSAERLVADVVEDAVAGVTSSAAAGRGNVSSYRDLLWVWHRLASKRWELSRVPLRSGRSTSTTLEVDHVIAFSLYDAKAKEKSAGDVMQYLQLVSAVNSIGNCSLLEKSFNISKSAREIAEFLGEVHEFKSGAISLEEWREAMCLTPAHLHPKAVSIEELQTAIEAREKLIKEELAQFIRGAKARVDLV